MFAGHTQQFVTTGRLWPGRVGGGGGDDDSCFKKRNSFTGSHLELILLHFLLMKPVGPGLRPCDPDVAHEQEA